MPSFNIQNISSILSSPKAALRGRRHRKSSGSTSSMSSVSSSSSIRSVESSSNVSNASSNADRRSSTESFHSAEGFSSPVRSVPVVRRTRTSSPIRLSPHQSPRLRPRPSTVDMCGFVPTHMDDDEDAFGPELVILEPRPKVIFDGVLETLDQANALPLLKL